MGQVPKSRILIIGNGRTAQHFIFYLNNNGYLVNNWHRQSETSLKTQIDTTDVQTVLLLIKDSAIIPFIEENPSLRDKIKIHFSGCLSTPLAIGMHPLMTFGHQLYDLSTYEKIPFICEEGKITFNEIFPDLKNPVFSIPENSKSYYHALCVLSGNFTAILWQKFFKELELKFNIPNRAAFPYLEQIATNLILNPNSALTGPLQRKDQATIQQNLKALTGDPFKIIYENFLEIYK